MEPQSYGKVLYGPMKYLSSWTDTAVGNIVSEKEMKPSN